MTAQNPEPISIVVEVEPEGRVAFDDLRRQFPSDIEVVDVKRFGGEMGFTALVVTLSTAVIPALAKVLIEHIRSKRHVRVKLRGIEITGINEETVQEILTSVLERNAKDH